MIVVTTQEVVGIYVITGAVMGSLCGVLVGLLWGLDLAQKLKTWWKKRAEKK